MNEKEFENFTLRSINDLQIAVKQMAKEIAELKQFAPTEPRNLY